MFIVFVPVWMFLFLPPLMVLRGQTEGFLRAVAPASAQDDQSSGGSDQSSSQGSSYDPATHGNSYDPNSSISGPSSSGTSSDTGTSGGVTTAK
jgi:hypothetical protein